MKNWKKISVYKMITYLSGAILILSGCLGLAYAVSMRENIISDQVEPVRLSFAMVGDYRMQEAVRSLTDIYEAKTGCIVDIYCFTDMEELKKSAISHAASGDNYDVFLTDGELLYNLKEVGEVIGLEDVVSSRKQEGQEFYEKTLKAGMIDDQVYAIPTGISPYMLYYNKDYTDAEGRSIQDIYDSGNWNWDTFRIFLYSLSERCGGAAFGLSNEIEDALTFLKINGGNELAQMVNDKVLMFYEKSEDASAAFKGGQIPVIFGDFSMTRALVDSDISWDIIPIPAEDGSFSNSTFSVSLIAAGYGKNEKEAVSFIDYYVSVNGQKQRLENGECEFPSLRMTFYTSMGDVQFPEHSNYYFYTIENGRCMEQECGDEKEMERIQTLWNEIQEGKYSL